MTVTHITYDELKTRVTEVLSQFQVSFEAFMASDLEDFTQPEVRDLWLMYHSIFAK